MEEYDENDSDEDVKESKEDLYKEDDTFELDENLEYLEDDDETFEPFDDNDNIIKKENNSLEFPYKQNLREYSTENFIKDFIREFSKIVSSEFLNPNIGNLSITKAAELIKRNCSYFSNILRKIKNPKHRNHNPNYNLTLEDLKRIKEVLNLEYAESNKECLKLIKKYIRFNKLKDHPHEIDGLKKNFFEKVKTRKSSYWFGFLTDGYVSSEYGVNLELSINDIKHLVKFCMVIGVEPTKYIKTRERFDKRTQKIYKSARVRFGSKKMVQDLLNHGYASSKSEDKDLPDFIQEIKNAQNNPIALAYLYGLYDADGKADTTCLYAADKRFLERLKRKYNIPNPVRDSDKDYWYIHLGARLMNKMFKTYHGLDRKRRNFDEKKENLTVLKERLSEMSIDKMKIENLGKFFTKDELIAIFGTSFKIFTKLQKDWLIKLPKKGYWSSKKGLEIKHSRDSLLNKEDKQLLKKLKHS